MIQLIIGEKIDQTQKFLSDGTRVPVTSINVPDNILVQIKTQEKDKYTALQIGFGKKKKPAKSALGHAKKAGLSYAPRLLAEVRLDNVDVENAPKLGEALKLEEVFKPGDIVDVTGTSKGKGFAGVVKRHNFRGGPKTHGQSDRLRAPGSIGQTTTPGRVYRGKRMAGHMGNETVTIKNLKIIDVDPENKILYVSGLVPGVRNSIVYITRTGEDKKFVPMFKEEPKEAAKGSTETATEVKREQVKEATENVATAEETVKTVEEPKDAVVTTGTVKEEGKAEAKAEAVNEEKKKEPKEIKSTGKSEAVEDVKKGEK